MQTLTADTSRDTQVSPLVLPLVTSEASAVIDPRASGVAPVIDPRAAGVAPVLPLAPQAPSTGGLQPILVAEDDEDDVFFIRRLLKKTGTLHPIKVFDDGSEVVNYLGGARLDSPGAKMRCPRLMFLDLNMRGLGGFGFLEWARQQEGLGPLTIVVLSNSNEPQMMERALELGAHRYLVKYPSVQTMTTIVRSVYPQVVF
jgi:CheY-like chemotaxis protein